MICLNEDTSAIHAVSPTLSPTRGVAGNSLGSKATVSVMAENDSNETLSLTSTTTLGKRRVELGIQTLHAAKFVETACFGRHIEKWHAQTGNTHFENQKTAKPKVMQARSA